MIRTIVVVAAVIALAGVACAESRTITELRAAADKSDVGARVALGDRYRFGDGVSQDDVKAAKWYRLAADQGHAKAQFELGVMYYYGW
jgi:TPR repeat protein